MKSLKRIESSDNPTLKALNKLKEAKAREREGQFLIEGVRETLRGVQGGEDIHTLILCPALFDHENTERKELKRLLNNVDWLELSERAFRKLSLRQNPDGVMAVATIKTKQLRDLRVTTHSLVLVIDGLEKPGNIGALLRTADAVNADAVIITGFGTDLYNPNVIRASMGSVFSRPVMLLETQTAIEFLQGHSFQIVAATPHATKDYWQEDFRFKTAIVLGTEHEGLHSTWLEAATTQVRIPMSGLADSLNVATAGALLLYEALRQKQDV
ncbi:MAG: TrmH family RNA methyltransferase [Trueperaceae bacterium]